MIVPGISRDPSEAEQERVHALVAQLDSLLDAPEASARLVAAGRSAIEPLKEFLIEGKPRSVPEPRIWAVRALAGLGADDVLLEYLQRPIASDDAILRFTEESVRNAAARALANSDYPGIDGVLLDLAGAEHLPAALTAIVSRAPDAAMPILTGALEDDFARDAASEALRRAGGAAREALIRSAIDRGNGSEASLRRRRAAVDLVAQLEFDGRTWDRLQPLLDESDPALVCTVARVGVSAGADPARIAHRLLEMLPNVGWEWLSTVEDMIVRCAITDGESRRILMSIEPPQPVRPGVISAWRRICRRVAAERS